VTLDTEFPDRLADRPLYVGEQHRRVTVEGVRLHGREALLKLAGVDGVEAADALRGQDLFIATADAAPLPAGRYYIHQIVGLHVWTSTGTRYGEVREVLSRPANDIDVVRHGNKDVLVPAIADVVLEIDIAAGRMVIALIPGLE
jgi:16S rRNA processing protein RimM